MEINKIPLYGFNTEKDLLIALNLDEKLLNKSLKNPYKIYSKQSKKKDKKPRLIEEPNDYLKEIQVKILKLLQQIDRPEYCYSGWKGFNTKQNTILHKGQFTYLGLDIEKFFPNTKLKYIKNFYQNELKLSGSALDLMLQLTTLNNHLPTGASTSPILSALVHKPVFDEIYTNFKKDGITFSTYADDINLSAKKGIKGDKISYIQSALNKHELKLNHKKTRRFNYKNALITGFYIHQSGKISAPYWVGHTIIQKLKEKPIKEMDLNEARSLLGYIDYQRQADKDAFKIARIRVIKQLKKLEKNKEKKSCVK